MNTTASAASLMLLKGNQSRSQKMALDSLAPLTPRSQLPPSPVSDEVESLKTQLAASEALVKQLTKEKFEAVDASRKLFSDVESLQNEQTQWLQEREVLMAKLGLLDEVEATPGLLPSSEEVWFAGSNQTPPQTQSPLLSPVSMSRGHRNPETPPSETHEVPEVTVDQPAASGRARAEPLVSEVGVEDDDALERIGSIFLTSTPADDHDGCGPGNATLSPATTPMAPYLPTIDPASSSLAYLSPQLSLNALGLFCPPDSPVQLPIPPPARSAPAPAQVLRTQPDLLDLASQMAGGDLCPGHVGHRDLDNRAKSFPKEVKASAGSRSPFHQPYNRTRLTRRDDSRIELDWTTKGGIGVHEMAGHEGTTDPPSVHQFLAPVRK
ncbi:hypothetical protein FRC04_010474 [Tulasnella sp. 424]|nr:hypothetical protein FRC04_010474 [Tulasnella sp. 424]